MIAVLVINILCMLNTSWDIYAIIMDIIPDTGIDE